MESYNWHSFEKNFKYPFDWFEMRLLMLATRMNHSKSKTCWPIQNQLHYWFSSDDASKYLFEKLIETHIFNAWIVCFWTRFVYRTDFYLNAHILTKPEQHKNISIQCWFYMFKYSHKMHKIWHSFSSVSFFKCSHYSCSKFCFGHKRSFLLHRQFA